VTEYGSQLFSGIRKQKVQVCDLEKKVNIFPGFLPEGMFIPEEVQVRSQAEKQHL
jgi:hypothetical protein